MTSGGPHLCYHHLILLAAAAMRVSDSFTITFYRSFDSFSAAALLCLASFSAVASFCFNLPTGELNDLLVLFLYYFRQHL